MISGGDDLGQTAPATVFVSDPSAEAERIALALRARGHVVADVPLSMLVARVAVQRPRVLILDSDADEAASTLEQVRELLDQEGGGAEGAGAEGTGIVLLGREAAAAGPLARGVEFFPRPVDIPSLLGEIEALTGPPFAGPRLRPSTPPPSVASMSIGESPPPPRRPSSLPPPSIREIDRGPAARGPLPRIAPLPADLPSLLAVPDERRERGVQVSSQLERLLRDAEVRIAGQLSHDAVVPSPEEEIEAVLPADVLAALDEPVDAEHDDDEPADLGAHAKGTTVGGGGRVTTGVGTGVSTGANGNGRAASAPRLPQTEPAKTLGGATQAGNTGGRALTDFAGAAREPLIVTGATNDADRLRAASSAALGAVGPPAFAVSAGASALDEPVPSGLGLGPSAPMPSVLAPGDAARTVAHAVVSRATGALCIESQEGVRRAVFREGDLVTAASGVDNESLLAFLVVRGDLSREAARALAGKLPPFGRHAGAALVAHGHLPQDQLWSVLRAHAEWVLGRMLLQSTGTATMEPEPPGRLRGEPSVFGGSTGAEVFVEVVRRVIAPEDALARLGGPASRVASGPHAQLVDECALEPSVGERLQNAHGGTVQALLDRSPEGDVASVLFALDLLGVIAMIRAIGEAARHASPPNAFGRPPTDVDALDEDAVRARVRARMQLVEEGDYFALLGVPRDATSYEVRRAFLELRRAFEPARLLTPTIADLTDDVRKIASVLDEAYEILKDGARRERYRRAIEGPRPA